LSNNVIKYQKIFSEGGSEVSNLFVCVLGISTVFLGLICIIVLCKLTSLVCSYMPKKAEVKTSSDAKPTPASVAPIANKQEIIAAVCAAIAEECGTEVSNIKVVSFIRA